MPRHVGLLRGVSPMNAKMPAPRASFEPAGSGNVATVPGSGNAVFGAPRRDERVLARQAEAAMRATQGRSFRTFVRPLAHLQALFEADPFAAFALPAAAKRMVTFLGEPPAPRPRAAGGEGRGAYPGDARPRDLHRLPAGRGKPGVHDADRQDLRRCHHRPHLGHPAQMRRRMNARTGNRASLPPPIPTIHA